MGENLMAYYVIVRRQNDKKELLKSQNMQEKEAEWLASLLNKEEDYQDELEAVVCEDNSVEDGN